MRFFAGALGEQRRPMLCDGNRDMEATAVSISIHGKRNLSGKPRDKAIAEILTSIKEQRAS